MQTLTSVRRRGWSGRIASLPLSFFLFLFLFSLPRPQVNCSSDLDKWGLKMRRSAQGSAFWVLNDVPLNLGGRIPQKLKFWGSEYDFQAWTKKIQILITWKLPSRSWQNFYRRYAPRMRLRGWSHCSSKQIQAGGGHHLWFPKNINNSGLDKDMCTKFHATWPKVEPEINSRDVIKWMSEAYVRRPQWL